MLLRSWHRMLSMVLLGAAMLAPSAALGQQASSQLVLETIEVEPKTAAPDTLCHLDARIRNGGKAVASSFAFRVKLDQRELGVYGDHLFLDPVEPGETRSLPLFSFWTDETGRPLPESGRIVVELTLVEARWMKEEKDSDGVLVWSDLGAVEGLPQTASFTVEIEK
jgi:hypothetical protein